MGYMDHAGCHALNVFLVLTPFPGVRIGYVDHTGRHQLVFWSSLQSRGSELVTRARV
jgi:hypothetical protein